MSAGDQHVPTANDRMADVLAERDEMIRNLRAELDRVRGEGMDAMDREEAANEALRLERAETARLRALLATVRCGRCGGSGRYFPPCDFCADSTHDHECPPSSICASCAGTGDRFYAALTPRPGAKES